MEEKPVTAPTNSASAIYLDTQFDEFLFAAIGEDKNGIRVTVLTGLARLNFDPWKKAAELSWLPRDAAKNMLGALIAKLPDLSLPNLEPGAINRLVDLLPARTSAPVLTQTFGPGVLTNARSLVVYVTLMAVIFGACQVWENMELQIVAGNTPPPAIDAAVSPQPQPGLQPDNH